MNQPIPTGPDLFGFAAASFDKARSAGSDPDNPTFGSPEESYHFDAAWFHSMQAQNGILLMIAEILDRATGGSPHNDLDAWRYKIGAVYPWETVTFVRDGAVVPGGEPDEIWEVAYRVPRHVARQETVTEEEARQFGQPRYSRMHARPEPPHVLLDVGTRVLVSDLVWDSAAEKPEWRNPRPGRISGHAGGGHKYRWQYESSPGHYSIYESFAFADNRVEVHPDGPECPPPPQPVKREPTGPVMYVQNRRGKQGRLLEVVYVEKDDSLWYRVRFFSPGAGPVLKRADSLVIIAADQVERCPSGQTGDECGSGENQCELCLADEDAEAEAIEGSMLRKDES